MNEEVAGEERFDGGYKMVCSPASYLLHREEGFIALPIEVLHCDVMAIGFIL